MRRLLILALAACSASPQPASDLYRLPVDDIATASPPTIRKSRTVGETAELLIDATASSFSIMAANLMAPQKPAEGWPYGAATWRPDWSLQRICGAYQDLMHDSACDTMLAPPPGLRAWHHEPVVGEPLYLEGLTSQMAAPGDWPAVMLCEVDGPGHNGDLTPWGMPGCRLAVDLGKAVWMWPGGDPANMVYRAFDSPRIKFVWTPGDEWAGRSLVFQLLVFCPRNVASGGMMVSGGLRVWIGRR